MAKFVAPDRETGDRRLKELAAHLRKPFPPGREFDFNELQTRLRCPHNLPECHTVGCAMGELPIVFPEFWSYPDEPNSDNMADEQEILTRVGLFSADEGPAIKPSKEVVVQRFIPEAILSPTEKPICTSLDSNLMLFFHLFYEEVNGLFYPADSESPSYMLPLNATAEEVADHIEGFIARQHCFF